MDRLRQVFHAFGTLPAAVLVVFLAAQVDAAGHQHAVDDALGDCAQCQHYSSPAVVTSAGEVALPAARRSAPDQPLVHTPGVTHYRLQARGPPALS
ncbi:MAG: hypothetical protein ACX93N_01610 [Pseudohaliea sp.]